MIQWEECLLEDATHVEINGEVHELGIDDGSENKHQVRKYNRYFIEVYMESAGWQRIQTYAFPILGIRCLRKFKPKPIEFEAIVKQDMPFAYLSNVPDGIPLGTKFRCVQIMEDEE
jgi:hypothetical protein